MNNKFNKEKSALNHRVDAKLYLELKILCLRQKISIWKGIENALRLYIDTNKNNKKD